MVEESKQQSNISTIDFDPGEFNIEYLSSFVTATSATLLNISSDFLHKEIHETRTQNLLKAYASDKKNRVLLISKVEKPKDGKAEQVIKEDESINQTINTETSLDLDDTISEFDLTAEGSETKGVELRISLKIQYLGL